MKSGPDVTQFLEYMEGLLDDFPLKRLDNIFDSGAFSAEYVLDSHVVLNRDIVGRHLSDQYGVITVIWIE
ncbi:hypothetical protein ES703_101445 [subsurface metagenome]